MSINNKLTSEEFNRLFDKVFFLKKIEKKIKEKKEELLLKMTQKPVNDNYCTKIAKETATVLNFEKQIHKEKNEIIDFLIRSSRENEELFEFRRFYDKLEELR